MEEEVPLRTVLRPIDLLQLILQGNRPFPEENHTEININFALFILESLVADVRNFRLFVRIAGR